MRIQYMSDLHMELWDNSRYLRANEFEVVGDVLVLAGDTFYLRDTIAPWMGMSSCPLTSNHEMNTSTFSESASLLTRNRRN